MIIFVEEFHCTYVTTDDDMYPEYRRMPSGEWEALMGSSWEPIDNPGLEEDYQRNYKYRSKGNKMY